MNERILNIVALLALLPALRVAEAGNQFKFNGGGAARGETAIHKDWKLIWEDDFSKDKIDKSKWNFEIDGHGGGNGELQYYTDSPKNAHIKNGEPAVAHRRCTQLSS